MIVVDSTVWIDFFRGRAISGTTHLRSLIGLIGTFCIERGHARLHRDRNFNPMATLFG